MRISLFGSLADAIGREVDLPVAPGSSIGDVRRQLAELYPTAQPILARPAVRGAIDDRIVDDAAPVPERAELAFLPPLSGG